MKGPLVFHLLNYHKPDTRWQIFGINDVVSFQESTVVKGLFHSLVPKDVVEAFTVAEYMMAHAYYHYPLFEEALSKVLRIIEMAVKFRCKQLSISLEDTAKNRRRPVKKTLQTLMSEMAGREPAKDLSWRFDVARSLRNSLMHPDSHTYSGAMSKGFIQRAVVLLNSIFLPESAFQLEKLILEEVSSQVSSIQGRPLVLCVEAARYLVKEIFVSGCVNVGGVWHYLLIAHPIMLNAYQNLSEHKYLKPLSFQITNFSVQASGGNAFLSDTGLEVLFYPTDKETNLQTYSKYLEGLDNVEVEDQRIYQLHFDNEVGKCEAEFYYTWLWQSDT